MDKHKLIILSGIVSLFILILAGYIFSRNDQSFEFSNLKNDPMEIGLNKSGNSLDWKDAGQNRLIGFNGRGFLGYDISSKSIKRLTSDRFMPKIEDYFVSPDASFIVFEADQNLPGTLTYQILSNQFLDTTKNYFWAFDLENDRLELITGGLIDWAWSDNSQILYAVDEGSSVNRVYHLDLVTMDKEEVARAPKIKQLGIVTGKLMVSRIDSSGQNISVVLMSGDQETLVSRQDKTILYLDYSGKYYLEVLDNGYQLMTLDQDNNPVKVGGKIEGDQIYLTSKGLVQLDHKEQILHYYDLATDSDIQYRLVGDFGMPAQVVVVEDKLMLRSGQGNFWLASFDLPSVSLDSLQDVSIKGDYTLEVSDSIVDLQFYTQDTQLVFDDFNNLVLGMGIDSLLVNTNLFMSSSIYFD